MIGLASRQEDNMKLLIVSDSHGNKQILNELASRYHNKVDAIVHCGDSELSSDDLIWEAMDSVRGNCDFDSGYQDLVVRRDQDYDYLITHGHRHDVKRTLELLKSEAKNENVRFVFYGHSHVLKFDYEDGIYFITPGSIQSPRGNVLERTYCVLKAEGSKLAIEVYNYKHEFLENISYSSNKLIKF